MLVLKMLYLAQEDSRLQVKGNCKGFLSCLPHSCGVSHCWEPASGSAQHFFIQLPFVLSRNEKHEPSQLTLGADSKLPWGMFHSLLFSAQSDQIDENLKLALQQDLTTMAPGLIIQVIRV